MQGVIGRSMSWKKTVEKENTVSIICLFRITKQPDIKKQPKYDNE